MGFFNKIKSAINNAKEQINQRQEEERKIQEEKNRFNPDGKSLEWFCSEDGIKTFLEYTTAQNYLLEETIKQEKEEKYDDYSLDLVAEVIHNGAKIPYVFFKKLIDNIEAEALDYVGPTDMLIDVLSGIAKPFYIDDDGEPQPTNKAIVPEEFLSVEKNPVLNYVSNFKCFKLDDDAQGLWKDKFTMWSSVMIWLGLNGLTDKDIVSKNPWIFSNDTYFNDMGTARKQKGFYKKCIELATNKKYFEDRLSDCE